MHFTSHVMLIDYFETVETAPVLTFAVFLGFLLFLYVKLHHFVIHRFVIDDYCGFSSTSSSNFTLLAWTCTKNLSTNFNVAHHAVYIPCMMSMAGWTFRSWHCARQASDPVMLAFFHFSKLLSFNPFTVWSLVPYPMLYYPCHRIFLLVLIHLFLGSQTILALCATLKDAGARHYRSLRCAEYDGWRKRPRVGSNT